MRAQTTRRRIGPLTPADEDALRLGLANMAAEIGARLDAHLMSSRSSFTPHPDRTWASKIHHPCARHLVHARLDAESARAPSVEALYRFDEGNIKEREVRRAFADVGFEIQSGQLSFFVKNEQISGKIDGTVRVKKDVIMVDVPRGSIWSKIPEIPVEIKSVNPHYFDALDDAASILSHPKWWVSSMVSQLNTYEWAFGIPAGLLVIKTFGRRPKIVPSLFNRDLLDADLTKNRLVNKHVAARTYPEPIPFESDVCELCDWYGSKCAPLRATMMNRDVSPSDVSMLEMFCDYQDAARKYEKMKAELIGDAKHPGPWRGVNAIAGHVEVRTETRKQTFYSVPKDVKAPFAETREIVITTIERVEDKK